MKTRPFVSVIIPNYNHATFLDKRINSVLNQSYQNFELIILDDLSKDNSADIISKYKGNPHISHIVFNQENSGSPFKQWQKGFSLAKGDLIWIAESDDLCEPSFLGNLITYFEQNNNLALAFCRSQVIDENDNKKDIFQSTFSKDIYKGEEFIRNKIIWGNCVVNASSAVFRKDIACDIDKDYMNFKGVGDWLFWTEIAEKGDVAIINEPLNYYRFYGQNTTCANRKTGNEVREAKQVFDYFSLHHHLSWIDALRIKKKYVKYIKYDAHFSEGLKKDLLSVWNNDWISDLLADISQFLHYHKLG